MGRLHLELQALDAGGDGRCGGGGSISSVLAISVLSKEGGDHMFF